MGESGTRLAQLGFGFRLSLRTQSKKQEAQKGVVNPVWSEGSLTLAQYANGKLSADVMDVLKVFFFPPLSDSLSKYSKKKKPLTPG